MSITEVLERHQGDLMARDGVVGVGLGEEGGRPAIVILVTEMTAERRRQLPESLEGYPVRVDVSGEIVAF